MLSSPLRIAPLIASLVAALAVWAAPAQAVFPGENGKIAVACLACVPDENGEFGAQGELDLFDPAGGPTELVPRGKSSAPSWSPDGRTLAYLFAGSVAFQVAIAIGPGAISGDLGGAGGYISNLAFAPNGKRVFFSLVDWFPTPERDGSGYYLAPLDGRPPTRIAAVAPADVLSGDASWAPDGNTLLTDGIQTINARTGSTRAVVAGGSPDWAPDGKAFAFHNTVDGNQDIYVARTKAPNQPAVKQITRITADAASDSQPAWSPDGKQIAFVSTRDGHTELYTVRPDGSGEQRLTHSVEDQVWGWPQISQPAWQPLRRR